LFRQQSGRLQPESMAVLTGISIYPQFFRNSFSSLLWSLFELYLNMFSLFIKDEAKIPIKFNDLKGSLLHRTKLYFEKLGNIQIINTPAWPDLMLIQNVRNKITHGKKLNSDDPDKQWKAVGEFEQKHPDLLSTQNGRVELKEGFCRFVLEKVKELLFAILNQMKIIPQK